GGTGVAPADRPRHATLDGGCGWWWIRLAASRTGGVTRGHGADRRPRMAGAAPDRDRGPARPAGRWTSLRGGRPAHGGPARVLRRDRDTAAGGPRGHAAGPGVDARRRGRRRAQLRQPAQTHREPARSP